MSALQLPPPALRPSPRPRHLRLVEARSSSLAPTGPLQAWRRRLGVLVVLAALVVVVVQAFVAPDARLAPATVPVAAATVVVQPGQTLWEVAVEHAPADTGTRAYVEQLAELNDVEASRVDAWQVLRLPSS